MKKLAIIVVAMASIAIFITNIAIANPAAPPVNQTIGFDDKDFNDMTATECRGCHGNITSDRHHYLYGTQMPLGVCSATTDPTPRDCYQDEDCIVPYAICSNDASVACNDASECPKQYQHPTCTTMPYCAGTSAAAKINGSQNNGGANGGEYGCLTCHEEETVAVPYEPYVETNFLVERDCMVCHEQLPNSPSVHHLDEAQVQAKDGNCKMCHGNIVDDMGDGHVIPTYNPMMLTPEPASTELGCSGAGYGPSIPCEIDADCQIEDQGTCVTSPISYGLCDQPRVIEEGMCSGWNICAGDLATPCVANTADPACDAFDVMGLGCANQDLECTDWTDCTIPASSSCDNTGDPCVDDTDCVATLDKGLCVPEKSDPRQGACNYCHADGLDDATQMLVEDNHDTHHGTGVYKDRYGNTQILNNQTNGETACSWCHYQDNPHNDGGYDAVAIRTCEGCHGMESLHSIQADSNGDGNIIIGFEEYGYGHVGIDDPNGDSDCMGCHGKVLGASLDLGGTPIVIPSIDVKTLFGRIAPYSGQLLEILGSGFTNDSFTSSLRLTSLIDGSIFDIIPTEIDADSMKCNIDVPAGAYEMVVNKLGVLSNPVVLIVDGVEVTITDVALSCGDCTGIATITGTGFGDEIPESAQVYLNVTQNGIPLEIVSWSDTEIVASGAMCDGSPFTVNGLFGSATK